VEEKVAQIFLLRSGKHQYRIWVEFMSGDHGGKGIKIRIYMGGYDLFWVLAIVFHNYFWHT